MKNSIDLNEIQMDKFAEAVVQHNIEKQLRERYDKILKENEKIPVKKGKIINIPALLKIAAVVVTVLGSFFLIQEMYPSPSAQVMAQNFLDQTNISGNPDITRKGNISEKVDSQVKNNMNSISATQLQREANDAFIIKDYPKAIAKYEALKRIDRIVPIDKFYLGISYSKVGNHTEAISHFQEIRAKESKKIEEIDWLLSLSYLISDQEEKAISILEEIVAEKRYKATEAEKLLRGVRY